MAERISEPMVWPHTSRRPTSYLIIRWLYETPSTLIKAVNGPNQYTWFPVLWWSLIPVVSKLVHCRKAHRMSDFWHCLKSRESFYGKGNVLKGTWPYDPLILPHIALPTNSQLEKALESPSWKHNKEMTLCETEWGTAKCKI